MDGACRALADAVGRAVVARDFAAATDLFAPWFRADLEAMVDEAGEGLAPPASWTLDENPIDLASLRRAGGFGPPSRPLPAEVTDANYRGWLCVQLVPAPDNPEELDVCFDLWIAAVADGGACRVGYLEAWEAT